MARPFRLPLVLAALSGFVAVAAGAFGAHGAVDPQARAWLQTGAEYQMIHALAVFACASVAGETARSALVAGWLFLAGSAIFAATLYAMALGAPHILGAVTPIGGLMLLAGWLALGWAVLARDRGAAT